MSGSDDPSAEDHNIVLDAADDDWAWRRKLRSKPHTALLYRIGVGVVGLIIVVIGLLLIPFPGPGWVIVFLGLAVWASEFEWAQRLLHFAKSKLNLFTEWLKPQSILVKALVGLATVIGIALVFWLLFLISGVPALFPDGIEDWIKTLPGLAD